MARAHSGCEVWQQDFLALDLPDGRFDGVFANAALFHVPRQELPRVLRELHATLKPGGVLFSSNPRGANEEGWNRGRYGAYHDLETWRGVPDRRGLRRACPLLPAAGPAARAAAVARDGLAQAARLTGAIRRYVSSSSAATTLRPSAARMLKVRHAAAVSITSSPTRASASARVSRGSGKRIADPAPNSTTSGA